ncbi:glycosyltransferase [Kineococcus sp. SYSU DK006]|uniref:glycosyltransferase n=1 Tax=Kineococcus sp. SYSU DK006 TaxID=3383127 RepID=UPI003D7D8951
MSSTLDDLEPPLSVVVDTPGVEQTAGSRARVLHVTEALGGVPVSIQHFIDATPYADHYYAALTLRSHPATATPTGVVDSSADSVPSPVTWRRKVREHVQRWQPSHIHFHSSFAGMWGRIRRFGDQVVVYTPHCYAFEREDLPAPLRRSLRGVEALLGMRTDVVAAISDREAELTHRLGLRSRATVVTAFNPLGSGFRLPAPRRSAERVPTVGTMGRITAQKDPQFFMAVVRHVRRLHPDLQVDWVWVGQGDERVEQQLKALGVRVTGWLPAQEAARELQGIDVYLHTAAWEGFPLAVVEALTQGIPVALRAVPALPSALQEIGSADPGGLAGRVVRMLATGVDEQYVASVRAMGEVYSAVALAEACKHLYR